MYLNNKKQKMKIAIMVAMKEELNPVLDRFYEFDKNLKIEKEKYFEKTFFKINFKNSQIIVVKSGIGKVNATITAVQLIEKFEVKKIIFSGVAGALTKDLKIGDIILAEKLAQWDVDLTSFGHEKGKIPNQEKFIKTSDDFLNIAQEVSGNKYFKEKKIKIKKGIIVSGDKFVDNILEKEKITKEFSASAVEMEGAPVAFVCQYYKVDFLILRSISDELNNKGANDFNLFLKESAKKVSEFLFKIIEKIVK